MRQKCIQQKYGRDGLVDEANDRRKRDQIKKPGKPGLTIVAFRELTWKAATSGLQATLASNFGKQLYLASLAIWWVRRDTFRLALFL